MSTLDDTRTNHLARPRPDLPPPPPGGGHRAHCIGCDQHDADPGQLTCPTCRQRLADLLADIPRLYGRLDATPGSAGSNGGRGAPGFGSRSPARDDVIVLTDARRQAHDPEQPQHAAGTLRVVSWWADEARVAGLLGEPRRVVEVDLRGVAVVRARTVAGECAALAGVVGRLASTWWFRDLLVALDAAAGHLRRAHHEHEQTVPLGACPRPAAGAEERHERLVAELGPILAARATTVPRCGGQVRARGWGHAARCTRCHHRWAGEATLRRLGAMLGDAMLDLPGLGRYLDVKSPALLRKWAQRDGWHREKVGRRTLYALADARASWWAAWDRAHPMHGPRTPPGWSRGLDGWRRPAGEVEQPR